MTKVFLESKGLIIRDGIDYDGLLTLIKSNQRTLDCDSLCLNDYNSAKELGDRRLLRAISTKDVIGLIALNRCAPIVDVSEDDLAMFIGAQVPLAADNAGYLRAVEEAMGAEAAFGGKINLAHPMTLLVSLANNVLCYGAIKHNARGVNSNYTNMESSSHLALINGLLAIKNNKAKAAYIGGYSTLCHDTPHVRMLATQGYICTDPKGHRPLTGESTGTRLADGACFITLTEKPATVEIIDGDLCNDGSGPYQQQAGVHLVVEMINSALQRNNLDYKDLGALFLSGHGAAKTDNLELAALDHIKAAQKNLRAYSVGSFTGNLTEAGGILELALSETMQVDSDLRAALSLNGDASELAAPYVLHLRTGVWGDHSCILTRIS